MTKSKSLEKTTVQPNSRKESISKLFALDIAIFNLAGMYSVTSGLTGKLYKPSRWEIVCLITGVTPILVIVVCEYLALIRFWVEDRDYAISLFTLIFDSVLCLVKGIRMWSQKMVMRDVLQSLKIAWNESLNCDKKVRDENVTLAQRTSFLCKCFAIMMFIFGISYAGRPYLITIYYYVYAERRNITFDFTETIYPIKYPYPKNTMTTYMICIFTEQTAMLFFALYWIASDAMFAKLCTFTTIQFRVLCNDLEHAAKREIEADDDGELIKRLSVIAQRHHDLYVYCKKIANIYNPIIFTTMLFTSANMCICVFQLDRELTRSNYSELLKHLAHAVTIISQVTVYCSYAERLTQQSGLVAKAAYNCQWMDHTREFKIILLIILSRAQESFNLGAYGLYSVNLGRITTIVNTAASYFTLLKTVA